MGCLGGEFGQVESLEGDLGGGWGFWLGGHAGWIDIRFFLRVEVLDTWIISPGLRCVILYMLAENAGKD